MFLNSTESVVFLPSDFEYQVEEWKDFDDDHNEYHNSVTYNDELANSLSETDLSVSEDELTGAIYSSLVNNEKLNDLKTSQTPTSGPSQVQNHLLKALLGPNRA
ncbi:hypothetical protein ACI65C_007733 [Semiaphis heraclei]